MSNSSFPSLTLKADGMCVMLLLKVMFSFLHSDHQWGRRLSNSDLLFLTKYASVYFNLLFLYFPLMPGHRKGVTLFYLAQSLLKKGGGK